jgi:hypothetical protein
MHANASTSSQTAEMLAIILLNNAVLPDDTLTAAKLELIRIAESRQTKSTVTESAISRNDLLELRNQIHDLDKRVVSDHNKLISGSNTLHVTSRQSMFSSTLRKVHRSMSKTMNTLSTLSSQGSFPKTQSKHSDLVGHRLEFRLDDAIHVLKSLDQSSSTIDQSHTTDHIEALVESRFQRAMLSARSNLVSVPESQNPHDLDNIIESKIQKALLAVNQSEPEVKVEKRKSPAAYRPSKRLKGPNGSKVCYDCGSTGHVCGDSECQKPSWATSQRHKTREDPVESNTPFFHQGHGK